MKPLFYVRELYFNGKTHDMKIGKQLKRAKDTAQRMLLNELVEKVDVIQCLDGLSLKVCTVVTTVKR